MPLTGEIELTVTFVDASSPADEITYWSWDFGDGSAIYEGQTPPAHLYDTPGVYTVTLHVSGEKGSDTFSDTVTATDGVPFATFAGLSAQVPATIAAGDCVDSVGDYESFVISATSGGPYAASVDVACPDLGSKTLYVRGTSSIGGTTLELPVTITVIDLLFVCP